MQEKVDGANIGFSLGSDGESTVPLFYSHSHHIFIEKFYLHACSSPIWVIIISPRLLYWFSTGSLSDKISEFGIPWFHVLPLYYSLLLMLSPFCSPHLSFIKVLFLFRIVHTLSTARAKHSSGPLTSGYSNTSLHFAQFSKPLVPLYSLGSGCMRGTLCHTLTCQATFWPLISCMCPRDVL